MKITKAFFKIAALVVVLMISAQLKGIAQTVIFTSNNSATVNGSAGSGTPVTDISNNGSTPTPGTISVTPVSFPVIGLGKTATIAIQSDGSYHVTYKFTVKNYSTYSYKTVQVTDDITSVFPTFTFSKVSLAVTSGSGLTVNPTFDGNGDKNLFTAASSTLGAGATCVVTLVIDVVNGTSYGTFNNTANASAVVDNPLDMTPVVVTDVSTNNNSPNANDNTKTANDFSVVTPVTFAAPDLAVTKTVDNSTQNTGKNVVFTIAVKNVGSGDAAQATLSDLLPAGFTYVSSTVTAGTYVSGTGVWTIGIVAAGATQTLKITAKVNGNDATAAHFINTATSSAPGDGVAGNNTSTATVTPTAATDLAVTITDGAGVTTYAPGSTHTYTMVVTNNGPTDVTGATVTSTFPSTISGSWTVVAAGGATTSFAGGGTGSISDVVNMPTGSTLTYTITANIDSHATGALTMPATVAVPSGIAENDLTNNTASDTDGEPINLGIVISDGTSTYIPGDLTPSNYTVTVTNEGTSDVSGATVALPFPTGFTGTWTASVTSGTGSVAHASGSGAISEVVSLTAGSVIKYVITPATPSSRTGNLVLTSTVTAPTGTSDTDTSDNTSTDTDTPAPAVDLTVTNTDGRTTYTAGTTNTYTIVVKNVGVSDATGASIASTFPASFSGATWTSLTSGGATGSGSGSINQTSVNIPSGGTITYTVTAPIASSTTTNPVELIATATVPAGLTDPTPANNTATDDDTPLPSTDPAVTITDGVTTYIPGGTAHTYTIVVSNNGPGDVFGVPLSVPFPTGVTTSWTSAVTGGATGNTTGTNTGNISETSLNIPKGGKATYTVTATIASSVTGNLDVTATITPPSNQNDTNTANNTATDEDTYAPSTEPAVTITDGTTTYVPGGTAHTYTVTVTNTGPSDVSGVALSTPFPTGVTTSWTSAVTGGATGNTTGTNTGNINETSLNIPKGATVVYTVTATIASSVSGNLAITSSLTVPAGQNDTSTLDNTSTDTDTPAPAVDLTVTNTDGRTTYTAGTTNTYTIVVKNVGVSDATGASIASTFPASFSGATWTSLTSGGATGSGSGSINQTSVNIPSGGTITYTVTAPIASSTTTNPVELIATATVPAGLTDPTPANNTATDDDTPLPSTDPAVTITDGVTTYIPGGTAHTYTIVVSNNGPGDVFGVPLSVPFPTGVTTSWTSAVTGGATGNTTGTNTGNISETSLNIPKGGKVTYTVTATIASSVTGNLDVTATITPPSNQNDTNTANNTATDEDTENQQVDLSATITDGAGVTTFTPGTTGTYTMVIKNNGPSDVTAAAVTSTFPAGVTGTWTSSVTGGATGNTNNATASGSISNTVNMPSGSTITYTISAIVPSGFTGNLVMPAHVATPAGLTDTDLSNNDASDTDGQNGQADLQITNNDGKITYTPGTTNTYTIVVTNAGPTDVTGATVTSTFPTGFTGTWTSTATGAATGNTNNATSSTSLNETVNMPSGSTITYTLTGNVASNVTGNVGLTATVTAPTGITDPTPANNTATDTDTDNPIADLQITNTDGSLTYTPGVNNVYTVVVKNVGPTDVIGATVTNPVPTGLTGTWTAVFANGATGAASGSGGISQLVNMPANSTITYTFTNTVPSTLTGNVVSTATASIPAGFTDPTPANNTAVDTDTDNPVADLSVTNTDGSTTYTPGTTTTYTVAVTNSGPTNVIGATVTDPLPAGTTGSWTAVLGGGATGTTSGTGNINQTVNMPVGSTITYTVTVTIPSTITGNLVSTATVTVPTGFTDPTPANNTAIDNDTQSNVNDLKIVKTSSSTSPSINTQITFTLVVSNNGPSAATGVVVTDQLPSGFTYVSSNTAAGSYNSATGLWTIGNLANGASATLTMVTKVDPSGNFVNSASVTANGTDPVPSNNSSSVTITNEPIPVANNDFGITIPNTPVTIDLLGNDTQGDGPLQPATTTVISQPTNGTVTINPTTGKAIYTPNTDYHGTDTFTYTVKDANGGTSNVATVTITINKPPVAINDNSTTTLNTPVVIDILANDVPGSSNLNTSSVIIIQQPAHGVVTINPSTGKATFTPINNYFGNDTFTYTVAGADGAVSNVATVNIVINDRPVIGLAKALVSAVKAVDGSFNITYMLTVKNYGLTALNNVSITDDLSQTFSGETINSTTIKTLGNLTVNTAYNGITVTQMLQPGNSLAVGQMEQIQVSANVSIQSTTAKTYNNTANTSAVDIAGISATDVSTDGIKPDPTTTGDVSPSTPTAVQLSKPKEFVPTGFSPNGDGVNDTFVIENAEGRKMSLEIYNRWGNRVYHSADYQNSWDAKSNDGIRVGEYVPDGTYYYIVTFSDNTKREGFLTIHR